MNWWEVPRRSTGNGPAVRRRAISRPNDQNIVPACIFAPALEKLLVQLQREILDDSNGGTKDGAIYLLAGRLASMNGASRERYARRIYDYRNGNTRAILADTVDKIFAACGETHSDPDHQIAELPAGMDAAREMVNVWCEDEEWTKDEREALARKMLHIGQGMCLGWDVIDIEICNGLELMFRQDGQ